MLGLLIAPVLQYAIHLFVYGSDDYSSDLTRDVDYTRLTCNRHCPPEASRSTISPWYIHGKLSESRACTERIQRQELCTAQRRT